MVDEISYSFNSVLSDLISGIPNVIKAALLLLVAWGVAVIVKNIVEKLLRKVGVGRALSRTPLVNDEKQGERIIENIAKLIYLLIFVLFLPSVFNALNMSDVSSPITSMMNQFLGFIPNLIAAAIIMIIGVFIARLVKSLFAQFFQTLNLDKWFRKISPEKATHDDTQMTLSNVLANVIFIVILIPFITMSLEALAIETITRPIQSVLDSVLAMIPNIFVAIILVIVGYYLGKFVGNLLTNILHGTGVNNVYAKLGLSNQSFDVAKFLGTLVQVIIVLFFTVEALNTINLRILNMIGSAVIGYLPFLLSAVLILGIGLFLANFVSSWIKKNTNSPVSAVLIKSVIITFAVFMTLDQLHFAKGIVNIAFLLILGGLMIAFAISFGIGGRDFAKTQLAKLQNKIDEPQIKQPRIEDNNNNDIQS